MLDLEPHGPLPQQIYWRRRALALGVAVLFDAFFIRMALVPATMYILGRSTWWMPKWLDRLLPEVDVEGTELEKEHA